MPALLPLVLAALILSGCGRSVSQPARTEATGPDRRTDPAGTLQLFTAAARDRDVRALWELLSARTRVRLGPTLADFERRAPDIERSVGSFTSGNRYETILSEPLDADFGVAAVARSAGPGPKGPDAFAASLRLERGAWRIELGGSLRLRALLPEPGATVTLSLPQIALEGRSRTTIVAGALWLDGVAFAAESGGVNDHWLTLWGRAGVPLEPGQHFVVGFARTERDIAAFAWSFFVGRAG